jgi:hypothetical protein
MKRITQLRLAALSAALAASSGAFAADPTSALDAFTQAATASTGFGPGMWGLAAVTVGILIGVKWIKRARGAA